MSRTENRTYTYRCDFCARTARGEVPPDGWGTLYFTYHDCGLTGYSTTEKRDACDLCAPKERVDADKPGSRVY